MGSPRWVETFWVELTQRSIQVSLQGQLRILLFKFLLILDKKSDLNLKVEKWLSNAEYIKSKMIEQQKKWMNDDENRESNKKHLAHVKENITNNNDGNRLGGDEEDEENIPYYKHCIIQ